MSFACVIYVCENVKKVIPLSWIYEDAEKLTTKKHHLAFYHQDPNKNVIPHDVLNINKSSTLKNNQVHKVYLYKIVGK